MSAVTATAQRGESTVRSLRATSPTYTTGLSVLTLDALVVWLQTARGKPSDVLAVKEDAPIPKPGPNEVLIKVHSVSLNPVGYKLMGLLPWPVAKLPMIPEGDFAGWVADPNGHDTKWKINDEVIGLVEVPVRVGKGKGAMAQYITVDAAKIVPKPSSVPFDQAAGLPTVGMTAIEGLFEHGNLQAGQRIMINGGSSSVGAIAIQLAKDKGATVVTSCSGPKMGMVKEFGADEVLDYTTSPLAEQLAKRPPVDLVFDAIGTQSLYDASPSFLKPEGQYVTISLDVHGASTLQTASLAVSLVSNFVRPAFLGGTSRKFKMITMHWDENGMKQMTKLMEQGKLRVPIDERYASDNQGVLAAYEKIMTNKAKGKIIVEMQRP
ncbi:hypothetical protein QFC22_000664 [Naganishia vaughanmartiniae]|uniref:Uncharacterized protein n=1 Tax=Naganishia vaughanmartiniae TaxID=1424756 RepID=A0ACC2XJQ8_9TREE|nr:hypothetical protein QFC22_000664 [Naganishia vaughanmartiniae]